MSGDALVSHSSKTGSRLVMLLMLKVAILRDGMDVGRVVSGGSLRTIVPAMTWRTGAQIIEGAVSVCAMARTDPFGVSHRLRYGTSLVKLLDPFQGGARR